MRELIFAVFSLLLGAGLTAAAGPNAILSPMGLFPALGNVLRELSLGGNAGDTAAWAVYAVLCILPLCGLLPLKRKRGAADILFTLASLYSLWLWRMLANPGRLMPNYVPGMEEIFGMMAGGVLVCLLVGGAILRLAQQKETRKMVKTAEKTTAAFALIAGYGTGSACAAAFIGAQHTADLVYAAVLSACSLAQTGALVWMLGGTADLLNSVQWGWFDEPNARLADALAVRSRRLLLITVVSSLVSNIAALCMAGLVTSSNVSIDLPVTELIAALCCMLLARFIREGVRIKAENDEFV